MSISASGLGSGIDIRGLVTDLLKAEGESKTLKFDKDESNLLAKLTGVGTLKSAMSEFKSSLSAIKNIDEFQKRTAKSADETIFTAKADVNATPGKYNIEVTQLAVAHKVKSQTFSNNDEVIGTGSIVFTKGTTSYSVPITSSDQTLEGIKNKINSVTSDTGVNATLVNTDAGTELILTSVEEGADDIFTVSITDDPDNDNLDNAGLSRLDQAFNTVQATGIDSIIKIDGATVTTSSNMVKDAIQGVTLILLTTNIDDPKRVTISTDTAAAEASVKKFVTGYNAVFKEINSLSEYKGKDSPSQGILIGDSTLRNLEIQIRREINASIEVSGIGISTLAQLGIKSNDQTGFLEIQSSKLSAALSENFDAVGNLFANTTDGLAKRMDSLLNTYLKADGILNNKSDSLNSQIDDIGDRRIKLERTLQALESRLMSQFIAMDALVTNLQSTGNFLSTQLDRLVEPLAYKK